MTTFATRIRTKIGLWNIRTANAPTKLEQIAKEFCRYKLNILGLCEMRWTDSGEESIVVNDGQKDVRLSLIYSCLPATMPKQSGVGMLLSPAARRSLKEWSPISDRILYLRFKSRVRHVSIVHCYAPTNTSPDTVKDDYYQLLSSTLNKVRKGDILIVIGDMNAQVGSDNANYEMFMGKHGLGTMNDNGERFVELCANNNLVIGGTLFIKKNINKFTWYSNDGITRSQLDHFTISHRWRRSLRDVHVYRGADAHTDHRLLVGTVQLKLAAIKQKHQKLARRVDPRKFRNADTRRRFIDQLRTFLEDSRQEEDTTRWEQVRNSFVKASENTIAATMERQKCYISDHTWELILHRKELFDSLNAAESREQYLERQRVYNLCDRRVKASARRDHRKWLNDLADEAQTAAYQHRMRDTYRITKQLCSHGRRTVVPVKAKDGTTLTNCDDQLERFTEHFREILNAQHPPADVQVPNSDVVVPQPTKRILDTAPSKTEIKGAIMKLKNGKSPGPDGIAPELFKVDADLAARELHPIVHEAWESQTFPLNWKEALIVKLPKKGNLSLCTNWRGIALQNTVAKLVAQIILDRLSASLEPILRKEQAGFRRGRACTDHVNTLRIIVEQSRELQSPLYLLFVDFEKAFDSIKRDRMWEILAKYGVPTKIINIVRDLYRESNLRVVHQGKVGPAFGVESGVKQGDILSPLLFLIVLDYVLRQVQNKQRGIHWNTFQRLDDLDYADDIAFMTHTLKEMREICERLKIFAADVGLKVNVAKTKIMVINPPRTTRSQESGSLIYDGTVVEEVESFQYLGSIITKDGGADDDVRNRIRLATQAFAQLRNLWRSRRISERLKLRIFNSNVKSVLLYGSETWRVTNAITNKLQAFVNKRLRIICGIFYPEVISNSDLLQRCRQSPLAVEIGRRKWKWIGHTLRKAPDDIARQAINWNPPGRRKPGGQRTTWQSSVRREAAQQTSTFAEVAVLASRRRRWEQFIDALRFSTEQ